MDHVILLKVALVVDAWLRYELPFPPQRWQHCVQYRLVDVCGEVSVIGYIDTNRQKCSTGHLSQRPCCGDMADPVLAERIGRTTFTSQRVITACTGDGSAAGCGGD